KCFYAFSASVVLMVCAAFGPVVFHIAWGTPVVRCERYGMNVDVCDGRDWSFMQARSRYQWMHGTMDADVCRRFVAGASQSVVKKDGAVDTCSVSVPGNWVARECDRVGLLDYDQCYSCR